MTNFNISAADKLVACHAKRQIRFTNSGAKPNVPPVVFAGDAKDPAKIPAQH